MLLEAARKDYRLRKYSEIAENIKSEPSEESSEVTKTETENPKQ